MRQGQIILGFKSKFDNSYKFSFGGVNNNGYRREDQLFEPTDRNIKNFRPGKDIKLIVPTYYWRTFNSFDGNIFMDENLEIITNDERRTKGFAAPTYDVFERETRRFFEDTLRSENVRGYLYVYPPEGPRWTWIVKDMKVDGIWKPGKDGWAVL